MTPLHLAILIRNNVIISQLIESGSDVNAPSKDVSENMSTYIVIRPSCTICVSKILFDNVPLILYIANARKKTVNLV